MTTEGKNRRHGKLLRPLFGQFGRFELALMGAPCSYIERFAETLARQLSPWKCAYVDADHADEAATGFPWDFRAQQAESSARFESEMGLSREVQRLLGSRIQLSLLNGNHFEGQKQLVLLHADKLESLQRKLHKLVAPVGLVLCELEEVPVFMQDFMRENRLELPVWKDTEIKAIADYLHTQIPLPRLRGLVLAGGKSERMGFDKTLIEFRGMPHRDYLLGLLKQAGIPSTLSVREEPEEALDGVDYLADRYREMGPYGAILSAFMHDPDAAWLVLASDLAMFDGEILSELVAARDPLKFATAFRSPVNGDPEPLVAIWEPSAYPWLLMRLSLGESCPRAVLRSLPVHVIEANDAGKLVNVNTKEELERVKAERERERE